MKFMRWIDPYRKFVAALLTVPGSIVASLLAGDHIISSYEWGNVVYATLGAGAVFMVTDQKIGVWRHTKTIIEGMTSIAVLTLSIVTAYQLLPGEWWQFVVLVAGTVGVANVENKTATEDEQ